VDRVKVLVVGVGNWGRHHCLSIRKVPRAELIGVVGRNPEKVSMRAAEMDVRGFTSIREAVKVTGANAATVALVHNAHRETAVELMEKGLHVYVDKPFGASLVDAQVMAGAADKAGVKLMAGFSQRYEPSYFELARLVYSGSLGRIRHVFAERQHAKGFNEAHWMADPAIAGGGAVAIWGIHDVDLAMHLVGAEPRRVYAEMEFDDKGRETQSHIMVRHVSEVISMMDIEYSAFSAEAYAGVLGEKGRAVADRLGGLTIYDEVGSPDTRVFLNGEYPAFLTEAMSAFINCIVDDATPPIPAEDGVRAWSVVDAAYRSARIGKAIEI